MIAMIIKSFVLVVNKMNIIMFKNIIILHKFNKTIDNRKLLMIHSFIVPEVLIIIVSLAS